MQIERPQPSYEEIQELRKLKKVIEQASADGVISKDERERISSIIYADGKVIPEELEMLTEMIHIRVQTGELVLDYRIF